MLILSAIKRRKKPYFTMDYQNNFKQKKNKKRSIRSYRRFCRNTGAGSQFRCNMTTKDLKKHFA